MRCRIRSRSGGLISVVDGVTCDDAASAAKKTKPDNQSLGIAVFTALKACLFSPSCGLLQFARRTTIHSTQIMISPLRVKGQRSRCRATVVIRRFHSQPGRHPD